MKRRSRIVAELNVVPYIDVMLVLLVIFMTTVPLMKHALPVNLPAVAAPALVDQSHPVVRIAIDAQGHYTQQIAHGSSQAFTLTDVNWQRQMKQLAKQKPELRLAADRRVAYDHVMALLSMLQGFSIQSIQLLSQPSSRMHSSNR